MRVLLCFWLLYLAGAQPLLSQVESQVVERMMRAETAEELEAAVVAAQDYGLSQQAVMEAKIFYGIRREDSAFLNQHLPKAFELLASYKSGQSVLRSAAQLEGLLKFGQAIVALDQSESGVFQAKVKEAFWLYPEQAQLFANSVQKHQKMQRLSRQVLDLTRELPLAKGGTLSLSELLSGQPALLLIFLSEKQDTTQPAWKQLMTRVAGAEAAGLAVGLVLKEEDKAKAPAPSSPVRLRDKGSLLRSSLEVTEFPTAVLLSAQGRVLHHAHPQSVSLWNALKRYSVRE